MYSVTGLVEVLLTEISLFHYILVIYLMLLDLHSSSSNLRFLFHRCLAPASQCGYLPRLSHTPPLVLCAPLQAKRDRPLPFFIDQTFLPFSINISISVALSRLFLGTFPQIIRCLCIIFSSQSISHPSSPYKLRNETWSLERKHEILLI